MPILTALDELRGRLVRLRRKRTFEVLCEAIGISRPTCMAFLRGDLVSGTTLQALEEWCEREESMRD